MKYKYTTVVPPGLNKRFIKRPLLKVVLHADSEEVSGFGLVDSGADKTLCNIVYAERLGIDLSGADKERFVGIGGVPIYCHVLNVEVKVEHIKETAVIPIGFIESEAVDILLGQEGFFDAFRIKFEKDHDVFEVTPVKKRKK